MNEQDIQLDLEQTTAVDMVCDLTKRLVSVTGEAGTGKTTLIKRAMQKLQASNVPAVIAAPTGKAARRIREATGYPAMTIHKLLAFNRPEVDDDTGEAKSISKPSHTRDNPLPYTVIIVDEYAMVSTALHRDLVDALPSGGCLRLFGDVRQLPPIENGDLADPTSPFQRCLAMQHTVTLKNIYRQEEGNGILEAARQINAGRFFSSNPDIKIVYDDAVLKRLYTVLDQSDIDWSIIDNQIITPARKTDIGTVRLNGILQARFNKPMLDKVELPRNKWDKTQCFVAVNDKVVCTTNTYDLRDYSERFMEYDHKGVGIQHSYIPCPESKQMLNGEVGRIIAIDEHGVLEIDFGDRIVEIPPAIEDYSVRQDRFVTFDPRKVIELAYALTTHKCQGSEYQNIIYTMANCAFYNLSKPNFYTAITRARKYAMIVTDQRSFALSLKRTGVQARRSSNTPSLVK